MPPTAAPKAPDDVAGVYIIDIRAPGGDGGGIRERLCETQPFGMGTMLEAVDRGRIPLTSSVYAGITELSLFGRLSGGHLRGSQTLSGRYMKAILGEPDASVEMYVLWAIGEDWHETADRFGMKPREMLLALEHFAAELASTKMRDGGLNVRACGVEGGFDEESFSRTLAGLYHFSGSKLLF
jgi:hypothetical protein